MPAVSPRAIVDLMFVAAQAFRLVRRISEIYGGRPGMCPCTDVARARYQRRLSGPLLDRFDLRVEVELLSQCL